MRVLLAALLLLPGVVRAAWHEASSAHFVVYADDREAELRRISGRLERYHAAMERMTGGMLPAPSPSNRLTVYLVRNDREVRGLFGESGRYLGGFYIPRAGGSLAVVPRVHAGPAGDAMQILLHEYTHHFLVSRGNVSMPRWVSEGAAEFFSSAAFDADGGMRIGLAAQHRASELREARAVPVSRLLDAEQFKDGFEKGFDSFYGKSWALFHYLNLGPDARRGQLQHYLALLAAGGDSVAAGSEAFGDLDQLDRELDQYLVQKTILSVSFSADVLPESEIRVRRLGTGEAAIMPVLMRFRRGVDFIQALNLVTKARAIASAHPGDAAVLAALAEAENSVGEHERAIAAAGAALALDPSCASAYLQKGYALFIRARSAADADAAYKAAIQPFLALNRLENDHPLPLYYYFQSFALRNRPPSVQAVLGLERAVDLAPFDFNLRMTLARHWISSGDFLQARAVLLPVAHHPHGGSWARNLREVIRRMDAGEDAQASALLALLDAAPPEEAGAWQQ